MKTLREMLHEAGTKYDGHVTNGSLAAQVDAVISWVRGQGWKDCEGYDLADTILFETERPERVKLREKI